MDSVGLLVRFEAVEGREEEVAQFLRDGQALAQQEAGTTAWFGVHFGGSEYGVFDVFADEAGREAHLGGRIASALFAQVGTLVAEAPRVQKVDVLATKFPSAARAEPVTKGILLTLAATSGKESEVEQLLVAAKPMVEEESDTIAWFAIRFDTGAFAIFDVFPGQSGRVAHLAGQVPRELVKHVLALMGGIPDPELIDVLAEKIDVRSPGA